MGRRILNHWITREVPIHSFRTVILAPPFCYSILYYIYYIHVTLVHHPPPHPGFKTSPNLQLSTLYFSCSILLTSVPHLSDCTGWQSSPPHILSTTLTYVIYHTCFIYHVDQYLQFSVSRRAWTLSLYPKNLKHYLIKWEPKYLLTLSLHFHHWSSKHPTDSSWKILKLSLNASSMSSSLHHIRVVITSSELS